MALFSDFALNENIEFLFFTPRSVIGSPALTSLPDAFRLNQTESKKKRELLAVQRKGLKHPLAVRCTEYFTVIMVQSIPPLGMAY